MVADRSNAGYLLTMIMTHQAQLVVSENYDLFSNLVWSNIDLQLF